jgi:hypothetical protein
LFVKEAIQMKRKFCNVLVISFIFLFAMVFIVSSGAAAIKENKAANNSQPQTYIPSGDDTFQTPDNGETVDDFSGSPIPAGFFGPGSLPYRGTVVLKGKPLPEYGDQNIDTVITRESGGYVPFTTSLRMKALSMESSAPITVSFEDNHTEKWDVAVKLSTSVASTLKVYPSFTFTRNTALSSAYGEATKEMDTGSRMVQMYLQLLRRKENNNAVIAPCPVIEPVEQKAGGGGGKGPISAAGDQGKQLCTPPVEISSSGSSWTICNGRFCISLPLTEIGLLAKHFAKFKLPRIIIAAP